MTTRKEYRNRSGRAHYDAAVPTTRSVLLRHDLPDGTWHYDWLIDPVGEGQPQERNLIAFRVRLRPDRTDSFDAERLADHRREYLSYEGPLSGERGNVRREAAWEITLREASNEELVVELHLPRPSIRLRGLRQTKGRSGQDVWEFTRADNAT